MLEEEPEGAIRRLAFHNELLEGVALLRHILGEAVDDLPPPPVRGWIHRLSLGAILGFGPV